jgi:hypothetical protein
MRTVVCANCHVEYYFKGEGKYLTFPWANGTRIEEIEAYYGGRLHRLDPPGQPGPDAEDAAPRV